MVAVFGGGSSVHSRRGGGVKVDYRKKLLIIIGEDAGRDVDRHQAMRCFDPGYADGCGTYRMQAQVRCCSVTGFSLFLCRAMYITSINLPKA